MSNKLLCKLVFAVLLLCPFFAHASSETYPAKVKWSDDNQYYTFDSADAACRSAVSKVADADTTFSSVAQQTPTSASCRVNNEKKHWTDAGFLSVSARQSCNPGDTGPDTAGNCKNACYNATGSQNAGVYNTPPDSTCPFNNTFYSCMAGGTGSSGLPSSANCVVGCSSRDNGNGTNTSLVTMTGDSCDPSAYKGGTSGSGSSSSGSSSSGSSSSGSSSSGSSSSGSSSSGSSSSGSSSSGSSSSGSSSSGSSSSGSSSGGAPCGDASTDCHVRVDETGTPTATDAKNALNDASVGLDQYGQDTKTSMGDNTKVNNLGFSLNLGIHGGSCSAVSWTTQRFSSYSMDVCKPLGMVRDLWSYAIYILAAIYIWRSGTSAVGNTNK